MSKLLDLLDEYEYEFDQDAIDTITNADKRIEELKTAHVMARKDISRWTIRAEAAEAQLERVRPIFDYVNNQADNAQIRLLQTGMLGSDKKLYDDTYWQSVLDKIRFDLYQALENDDG